MVTKTQIKVGHTVKVSDCSNFYNGKEVVVTAVHDGFCSVEYNGNISFCVRNIHLKYSEYQD